MSYFTAAVSVGLAMCISMDVVADDLYKPVNPKEIACALKSYHYDGLVAKGGMVKPFAGKIGEFHCGLGFSKGSKKIELATHSFKSGGVDTRQFGIIRVRFRGRKHMIMMTDAQKNKLMTFLRK